MVDDTYKLSILKGVISINYPHPVQLLSMKFKGQAEFEVIPEDCFAIYNNNQLIVIFDNEKVITDLFNYNGEISINNIIVGSKERKQKIETLEHDLDEWENKPVNWDDESENWEDLDESRYKENPSSYKTIVKFKRNGKTFVDPKTLKKGNWTSLDHKHKHTYVLDEDGNGKTSFDDGHQHQVSNYVVQRKDGHFHIIKGKGKRRYGIK